LENSNSEWTNLRGAGHFERFDNMRCHSDFAEWTEHGGLVFHGRSDATLNPSGVRIGTAEIYNQVEQLDEVAESIIRLQKHSRSMGFSRGLRTFSKWRIKLR
jgi:acyl-coenzyme A synthetase/AMP-(fatty) acid ligase